LGRSLFLQLGFFHWEGVQVSYPSESDKDSAALRGADGELVFVRVRVDSRLLEDLLDALAQADFPINPEIRHGYPDTFVEFPAYDQQVPEIRSLIQRAGIRDVALDLANMLTAIA
jgi:hypothetical protein